MADDIFLLYYWPMLPGRGEFVRLALEDAGATYEDVARMPEEDGGGISAVLRALKGAEPGPPPLAPPVLKHGEITLCQTANILLYLGPRLGLCPRDEAGRLAVNQLQLTLEDLVSEVHATHHPVATALYYEDQKAEAARAAEQFLDSRLGKFLGYFETVLLDNGGANLVGAGVSYADLSLFQVVEGLRYAFPNAMGRLDPEIPAVSALAAEIIDRPGIRAYLGSDRRIPFNEDGIFRSYPELDPA